MKILLYKGMKNFYELNDSEIIIMNTVDIMGEMGIIGKSYNLIDKFNINENQLENRIYCVYESRSRNCTYIVLKDKYLFAYFDHYILVVDIPNEYIIKKFEFLNVYESVNLFNFKYLGDNYFLLKRKDDDYYLFEFDIKKNNLSIIGYNEQEEREDMRSLLQLKTTNEFIISSDEFFYFLCDYFETD